ncbi:MAG: hypothetical protein HKN42_09495 [Granulosicoccus sp.]|nr:hypothetical protein [Granulosicoccus sp.]
MTPFNQHIGAATAILVYLLIPSANANIDPFAGKFMAHPPLNFPAMIDCAPAVPSQAESGKRWLDGSPQRLQSVNSPVNATELPLSRHIPL